MIECSQKNYKKTYFANQLISNQYVWYKELSTS